MSKIEKNKPEPSAKPGWSSSIARSEVRIALLIAAVFVLGTSALHLRSNADAAQGPARPLTVETITAEFQDSYTIKRRFAGRVEAERQTRMAFERPGLVTAVLVEEGEAVRSGQAIAIMDTDALSAQRAQLEADRARLAAQLELARLTTERQKALSEDGFASVQRFDDARLSVAALEASVTSLDAAIQQIDINLGKSILKAPFDGIVATRLIDEGAVIDAGMAVVDVLGTERAQARIGLPPDVASSLSPGERYSISYKDQAFDAFLSTRRADLETQTQTMAATFTLDGADKVPFQEVVHFVHTTKVSANGVWLPLSALIEGEKGLWSVYTVSSDAADRRVVRESVEIVHLESGQAYVRGTLRSDAQVLLSGSNRVVPGQRVALAE